MQRTLALCTMLALSATAAGAQGRGHDVPPGHLPPPGSCRVWVDDVPPGQQPAPTSCAEAVRTRPGNAVVIYGDETGGPRRYRGKGKRGKEWKRDRDARADDRRDDWERDEQWERERRDRRHPVGVPRTLPEMISVVVLGDGRRSAEQERWLGAADVVGRYSDADRDGQPERIVWRDRSGRLLQEWRDANRDGRADRVTLYRDGRVARVIGR